MTALPVLFDRRAALLERPGGWERMTSELATRLEGTVTLTPARPHGRIADLGWEWVGLPAQARRYELVHLPAFPPTPALRGCVVWTLHDLTWWRFPELASPGGRHYYRRLAVDAVRRAHVVTVSVAVADEIRTRLDVPAARVTVIPPGVGIRPSAEPELRARPYLLAVGAVEPRKNLPRLLAAYAQSSLAGRVDLVVVGRQGWGADLPPGAVRLGAVPDERLDALYAGALAVVAVSTYEGFGLPVAEAMAAGRPVLCSDIPAFREVAGSDAAYVDPLDVSDIARGLRRAADHELPVPTPAAVRTTFDWARCAQEHERLYRHLLGV